MIARLRIFFFYSRLFLSHQSSIDYVTSGRGKIMCEVIKPMLKVQCIHRLHFACGVELEGGYASKLDAPIASANCPLGTMHVLYCL